MRMKSRVEVEQTELDRAKFNFLFDMHVKLRPSSTATLVSRKFLPAAEKIALKFYSDLMDELFVATGYALNEVALFGGVYRAN